MDQLAMLTDAVLLSSNELYECYPWH